MVTDDGYTYCGEHNVMYKLDEPLCFTSETNNTLYIGYTSIILKKAKYTGNICTL